MKAIIYAGIGLFSVAAVYGIGDYYHTNTKNAVNNMYTEMEEAPEETVMPATPVNAVPAVYKESGEKALPVKKASATVKKQRAIKPRIIKLDDYSRGRIAEEIVVLPKIAETPPAPAPMPVKEEAVTEPKIVPAANQVPVKNEQPTPEIKAEKRAFTLSKFSRAAPVRLKKKEQTVTE